MLRKQHQSNWWLKTTKALVVLAAAGGPLVIRHAPQGTRFWGDDALLKQAADSPRGFSSAILTALSDTGQDKWRPLTQVTFAALNDLGLLRYEFVDALNAVGIGVLALIVFIIARNALNLSFGISVALTIGASSSRFTPYSLSQLFGIMEIAGTTSYIVGIGLLIRCLSGRNRCRGELTIGILALFSASLFHERFAIGLFALLVYLSFIHIRRRDLVGNAIVLGWLLIGLHWVVRVLVLQVDAARGGGAKSLREDAGPWILKHVFQSIASIFGGVRHEYIIESTKEPRDYFRTSPSLSGIAIVCVPIFLSVLLAAFAKAEPARQANDRANQALTVIVIGAIGLIVPASLVFERIETRWLFASELLCFLAIAVFLERCLPRVKSTMRACFGMVALAGWLSVSFATSLSKSEPYRLRDKANEVLMAIENAAPSNEKWAVAIDIDQFDYESWMFGYGYSLTRLSRPPSWWVPNGNCPDVSPIVCVNLKFRALDR